MDRRGKERSPRFPSGSANVNWPRQRVMISNRLLGRIHQLDPARPWPLLDSAACVMLASSFQQSRFVLRAFVLNRIRDHPTRIGSR